jgi:hypothetical protein
MNLSKYVSPEIGQTRFTCPNCSTLCRHDWFLDAILRTSIAKEVEDRISLLEEQERLVDKKRLEGGIRGKALTSIYDPKLMPQTVYRGGDYSQHTNVLDILGAKKKIYSFSVCQECNNILFWLNRDIIYPAPKYGQEPSTFMPEDVADLYNQARGVYHTSRISALFLLRLAVEKLCKKLLNKEETKAKLFALINELRKKDSLPENVINILDSYRSIGDIAVHEGLDVTEELEINPDVLFRTIDYIVVKTFEELDIEDKFFKGIEKNKERFKN